MLKQLDILTGPRTERDLEVRPRPLVAQMRPYRVPDTRGPLDLRLDANEGSPPPDALQAPLALTPELLRRYPGQSRVEALLADRFGCTPGEVFLTAGADDAIDRCCRAVLEPGRTLVMPVPTFEMIGRSAQLAGAEVVEVEWADEAFPTEAFRNRLDGRTGMVAIVTPNNPTGLVAPRQAILSIAEAAPRALVLVDLAYVEFALDDPTAELLTAPNIVVVRTFSKAWGLAGLRLGYALGRPQVIQWLGTVGGPYPASGPSLAVAEAALCGSGDPLACVARVRTEREALHRLLLELGFEALPSEANFVFARHPAAEAVRAALLRRRIAIRGFADMRGLQGALRITCPGDADAFTRLTRGLRAAAQEVMR